MPAEPKRAVVAALTGNLLVAVSKFGAAMITGSSAMFSEGIHSVVDTCNEGLLLVGLRRGRRPPDDQHPLGYAHELYFWSFVVAVVIFGLGGGVAIYEGTVRLRTPEPLGDPFWNYVVLGLAAVFEGTSLAVGYRQFRRQMGAGPLIETIRRSKDPTVFTVVLEDSAALAGLAIAFLGIYLGHVFGNTYFGPAASILIGMLLGVVALFISYEVRGLLVGESAEPKMVRAIKEIAQRDESVERANRPVTVYLGPSSVLLGLELQFVAEATSAQIAGAVDRIERAIRERFPEVDRIYVEAESIGPRRSDARGRRQKRS